MVQITLNLPKKENLIVEKHKKKWRLNKADTLFKIIREFKEKDEK